MSPGEYRKLPGDFRGFFRRNTLWLGQDHLLLIDSTRFSETYKRFYLPDIQTIIIRKTPRFVLPYYWVMWIPAAFLLLLMLGAGFTILRAGRFDGRDLLWPGAVLLAAEAVYLYVASMFQSCTCHLVTRVNRVELKSLFRLRAARKFVDLMAPRILAIQGNLPEGWVERTTTLAELSTAADRNPDALVDVLPSGAFSWLPVFVFVFVLIDAGLTLLELRVPNLHSLSMVNVVNMIALALCGTVAIVRLSRQKSGRALRLVILAGLFVVAMVTYGGMVLASFDQQFYHRTFQNVLDYPGMRFLAIVEIVLDFLIAIPGLILVFRQPQSPPKPTSLFGTGAPPA